MFTVCVGLVFSGKYVQFQIICTLSCGIIVDTFKVTLYSLNKENA